MKQFDIFISALRDFESLDKALYKTPRNRTALCHALAVRLMKALECSGEPYFVDMAVSESRSKKIITPDILVHDRKGGKFMAVVCRNDYLSEGEQEELNRLTDESHGCLCLGLSFFPQKNYMLIYTTGDETKYLHFSRNTLTCEAIRVKSTSQEIGAEGQMAFKLKI